MHFRKLVAIVVRDFVGHILLKSPLTITPEEIEQYLNTVKCRSELVNDIFLILFKNLPKHKEVREFVECWTRNPRVLIGPIFPDTYSVIHKRFKFNDSDFDPYDLKLSDWNCAVHNNFYDPYEATILKIQEVLAEYDHPVFPSSRLYEFCDSKMSLTKNISYFRFPSDPLRCKQWMEKCQTENLLKKKTTILYKNYRVCGVHFEDNMFLNPSTRNRLTMNAVPTIFSAEILLKREMEKKSEEEKEKKLGEEKEMREFEAQVAMASCSSPSHSLSYNDNVYTNVSDVSSSSSISSKLQVSTSDSSCQTPLYLTNKTPRKLKLYNELQSKNKEIKDMKKQINAITQQLVHVNTVEQLLTLNSELELLVDLVMKQKKILENKKTDAITANIKNKTWEVLTKTFNSKSLNGYRNEKCLRSKYDNLKKTVKIKWRELIDELDLENDEVEIVIDEVDCQENNSEDLFNTTEHFTEIDWANYTPAKLKTPISKQLSHSLITPQNRSSVVCATSMYDNESSDNDLEENWSEVAKIKMDVLDLKKKLLEEELDFKRKENTLKLEILSVELGALKKQNI
ncbi:hypothetical protein ACI65C_013703 [Semiaphis heraclei]